MGKIILIKDLLDSRKRKEKELLFYNNQLANLEIKRNAIMKEIHLTNRIIKMIENEKIEDVRGQEKDENP